jgi:hypothetical protein
MRVVDVVAAGLPGKTSATRRKLAWTVLAALSGDVTLARAAEGPKVGGQIAGALKATIDALLAGARDGATEAPTRHATDAAPLVLRGIALVAEADGRSFQRRCRDVASCVAGRFIVRRCRTARRARSAGVRAR